MKIGFQEIKGYAYGAVQPSALLSFEKGFKIPSVSIGGLQTLYAALQAAEEAPLQDNEERSARPKTGAALITAIVELMNRHCGDQRFTQVQEFEENNRTVFAVPTLSASMVLLNLRAVIRFLQDKNGPKNQAQIGAFLKRQQEACKQFLPRGTANGSFIALAAERRIPFQCFSHFTLIFGYGSGSSILSDTVTDHESIIGANLSGKKNMANQFLAANGFPVADQAAIKSLDDAKRFAEVHGYPVVLKPTQGAQGKGVFAGIPDEKELAECFKAISRDYSGIIIEKHIAGDHYRIDFMGDQLIKAVRRRPASVVGDGKKTLRDLIEAFNQDPIRQDPNSSMKPVVLDDDLGRMIEKQGISLSDVPETGRRIVLRSISNLSRGGVQQQVEDMVHPENYALCQSIARTMRIEISGIDILSPDLSRPWHENGAVVCEVNVGPQMGSSTNELYWRILKRYLRPHATVTLTISEKEQPYGTPLFDTDVSELNLRRTPADIFQNGCPTQYFNSLEISDDVSAKDRQKLEKMLVSVEPQYSP